MNSILRRSPKNAKGALIALAKASPQELQLITSTSNLKEVVRKILDPQEIYKIRISSDERVLRENLMDLSQDRQLTNILDQKISVLSSKAISKAEKLDNKDSISSKIFLKYPQAYYLTILLSVMSLETMVLIGSGVATVGLYDHYVAKEGLGMNPDTSLITRLTSAITFSLFTVLFHVTINATQKHIFNLYKKEVIKPTYDVKAINRVILALPWLQERIEDEDDLDFKIDPVYSNIEEM